MAKSNVAFQSWNRGEVSKLALARVDLEKMRLAAEEMANWMPSVLGPMSIRPGFKYVAETRNDSPVQPIEFIYASDDLACIEVSDATVRVLIDDTPLTRAAVSTTVTNGDMGSSTGWTLATTGGASSAISGGKLTMSAPTLGGKATATSEIIVAGGDQATRHALRVVVTRGPVVVRIGTSAGATDIFPRTSLDTGEHSLAFTPSVGSVFLRLETTAQVQCIVDSATIEAAGVMTLPGPWATTDLDYLRWQQSNDVVFIADGRHQQRRIQRYDRYSWAVVLFKGEGGPFKTKVDVPDVSITPSGTDGNITLTASAALWETTHVGMLVKLTSIAQAFTQSVGAADTYTTAIKVTGSGSNRQFDITRAGTWVGTLRLYRSFDGPTTGFAEVSSWNWNGNGSNTFPDDGFANVDTWYRIGFGPGDYTSGTASITLNYTRGGGIGIARVTGFTSSTVVDAEVLTTISSVAGTKDWRFGNWNDKDGWPSSVALFDGRLWWAGQNHEWGSVSDDYTNYDSATVGDSGPLDRTIGFGPVNYINWLLPLQRLIVGTVGAEVSIRSSSFDEPLTPTNFSQKAASTQGSAPVPPVQLDKRGLYVQASRRRLFELRYDVDNQDYVSGDLTKLHPEIAGASGNSLVRLTVARQPDTRIFAVRSDGQCALLVYEPNEDVACWCRVVSDGASGTIENVYALPGDQETRVYAITRRVINGTVKRFHERLALMADCQGLPDSHLADCHIVYSGASTAIITGLSHLEGESVVAWGYSTGDSAGKDLGTYTVSGGQITLSQAVTNACVGLPYTARYKTAKLAYGSQMGTALAQRKRLNGVALVLHNTHYQGLSVGQDYDHLDALPLVEDGAETDADKVWDDYDRISMPVPGDWSTDARLCMQAASPRPVTVMGAVLSINEHDRP